MRSLVKPLAIVLAVPLIVTTLGILGRANWEAGWNPWLARQAAMQPARPYAGLLVRPSLATVCAGQGAVSWFPPCRTYNLFSEGIGVSAAVGGAGVLFLGVLVLAGRWCRWDRRRVAWLFRPALVFATVGTACLGVAHGLLAAGAVVIGAVGLWLEPVERLSSSLVLVALVAGVVWALAMASVAFSLIRRPTMSVVGQVLDPSRQRSLADFVAEVSQAVGAEPPAHTVACLIPWLFVTEMKVACLDGTVSGRTLCLSLPLVRILSVDEFRAQLAHELAHYSREQAALTVRVVSAFVGASRAMRDLAGRSRGLRAVVSRPPLALVSVFMNAVGGDAALGGDCEAAADQAACAVAGREALASGLVKLAAFAPAWHAVFAMMQSAAFADTQYLNVGAVFQEIAASNSGRDRLAGVGATMQGHPTDRHPALSERLAALGLDLGDVADAALLTVPVLSAASLIEGGETIEQRLTTVEHQMIVETGGRIPAA